MSDILETSPDGRFRVVLENDTDADPSDRQGAGYVFYADYSGRAGGPYLQADEFDRPAAERVRIYLEAAMARFPGDLETVARYFRTIGCAVDYFDTRDGRYVGIVTPELEESWGCEPGTATPDLSEWQAREDGDVYGYAIEEACTWTTTTFCGPRTREGWESVDDADSSLWGMYGYDYAAETAREAFTSFLSSVEVSA